MQYIHTLCPLLLVGRLELNLTRAGCWLISSLGDGEESKRVPVEGPVVFFFRMYVGFQKYTVQVHQIGLLSKVTNGDHNNGDVL